MIIVTGAAGFIGSALVGVLNSKGYNDLVLVDDFTRKDKAANLHQKTFSLQIDRKDLFSWLKKNHKLVQFVFHLGARTDTTEFNKEIFDELNVSYSKEIWKICTEFALPLVYASSAATYGNGDFGYDDNENTLADLQPLNPYGWSKHEFDLWTIMQEKKPYFWAGLKFFNVYGPNEYHKGRMASVVYHAFRQIEKEGKVKLFRSHRPDYEDGKQLRDFIYVKDVAEVCCFFLENRKNSGLYNLGSGKARTFLDLTNSVFKALGRKEDIEWVDTPADIRDKYQYFTEAKMEKLRSAGFKGAFHSLEEGINDYVRRYLISEKYL